MLHALPKNVEGALPEQLLEPAHRNIAHALHRCQDPLELDGGSPGFNVEEWLPTVYDTAGPLLQSARLDKEPPTIVLATQEAISWLSRAITELDESSEEPRPASPRRSLACSLSGPSPTPQDAKDVPPNRIN